MYFGVFTGSDILMCLQEVLFCHVYRYRYFGVFTGSDCLMCLQEVMFRHVYRWRYFGVFMTVMFCSPVMILCCVYR